MKNNKSKSELLNAPHNPSFGERLAWQLYYLKRCGCEPLYQNLIFKHLKEKINTKDISLSV